MGNVDFKDWSDGWIKSGHFISYLKANVHYFEHVLMRELTHWEMDWQDESGTLQAINALGTSGPFVPPFLEVTKSYDADRNENRIWQLIFGIKGQVYIYIELPADTHRHGLPKLPKPRTNMPRISHFTEIMSPYEEPSFLTEHFMMRPDLDRLALSAYNPNNQAAQAGKVSLNFFINRMSTERVGTVVNGAQTPTSSRWSETLDKLWKRLIPCRPLDMYPVQAPAEAHH